MFVQSASVAKDVTIGIILTLFCMASIWIANVLVFKETFLCDEFKDGKIKYMNIPQGFKKFYEKDDILLLQKSIYEIKQAVITHIEKSEPEDYH